MVEPPLNMMDDLAEGIKRSFWSVSSAALREIRFQGSVVETSELVSHNVPASSYQQGLILLSQDNVDLINSTVNPVINLPELHLGDSVYDLRRRIVRELLPDDSIKVTEIQELVPVA